MRGRDIVLAVVAAAAVAAVWSMTGGKSGGRGSDPSQRWGTMRTPATPAPYTAPCPAAAVPDPIVGPHPIKAHPASCSPRMTAAMASSYDWMFCPPSEDDL